MTDRLASALSRHPLLVLDAAMGTRLIARGLDLRDDDPARWNLSRPDEVARVHALDVAAGSDALLSNTFGANRAWLARFGLAGQVGAINRAAVGLARTEAGPGRLVLGSICPTAADDPSAAVEQAEALADAGVDALVFETYRLDPALGVLKAVRPVTDLPILASLVAWPDDVGSAALRLIDLGVSSLGGNCQDGMGPAVRLAEALRRAADLPLIVKPAAGLPGATPAAPGSFAAAGARLRALGPVLVGGCCGTTEAHVAALRAGCYAGGDGSIPDAPEEGRPP